MAEDKKHKKPTQKELQEEIEKSIKEVEDPQSTPSPSTEAPSPSTEEPSPSIEAPSPSPSPYEATPSPSVDYKEKYKGSTREALVHKAGREALAKAIKTADGLTYPTDDEMIKEYPDWDLMDETQQKLARKTYINDRRFELINNANQEASDLDNWIKKVEDYAEDPKVLSNNPELEGKEAEFRSFAITPSRRGVPLEDLLRAFLYDATKKVQKKNKGEMFEKASGGSGTKGEETSSYSPQEAQRLRRENYNKYKEYINRYKKEILSGNVEI